MEDKHSDRRFAPAKGAAAMEVNSNSSLSPPATKALRRGRREKPWPAAKQRKLLRLYVCTQSERLPLVRILERLRDGEFDPR